MVVDQLNNVFNDSNVYTPADVKTVSDGGTVEIKLSVQKNDESSNKSIVQAAMTSGGYSTGSVFDVDMTKTSILGNGVSEISSITEVKSLMKIIIPLPAQLQGKDHYVIYCAHDYGSGVVEDAITTSANAN